MRIAGPNPFLKELLRRFRDDDVAGLGAQLAYSLLLSFFPFLIVLFALLSYLPLSRKDVMENLASILPQEAYLWVQQVLKQIRIPEREVFLSFGTIMTVIASANGAGALMKGLNKAYNQKESRSFIKTKMISILFILGLAIIILINLTFLVFGQSLAGQIFQSFGISGILMVVWELVMYTVPLLSMLLVFIAMYQHIPNHRLLLREVLPGAVFSISGWLLLSTAFSFYVSNYASYSKTYGSIGGIIVLLLWLYWSSLIILFGGELNALLFYKKKHRPP